MSRILRFFLILTLIISHISCSKNENSQLKRIDFVEELISQMTLDEKVGQMTQVTLQTVSSQRGYINSEHQLDKDKLKIALLKYHVGSILNVWEKAKSVNEWHNTINTIQKIAVEESRMGIPLIYGIDAIHGASYTIGATLFPQAISIGAARDINYAEKIGEITALEVRASGIPWNFNPVLGLGRMPLWPRFWETYGEDTYLAGELGSAYINGLQGSDPSDNDRVAACAKHYLGYSVPRSGHDRTPAIIPDRTLREIFLPPFKKAVEAGVLSFMINSGEINGTPVHASHYLLTDILINELGFEGIIVSDWADINNLYTREKVASSQREAVKIAVMAGIDMSMVPYDFSFFTHLVDLVKSGEIPESRIDESVRRILNVKYKLGLFDKPYADPKLVDRIAEPENTALNRQIAAESLTLLKNQNSILPLKGTEKIFISGPTANKMTALNGGWTITWQGNEESLYPDAANTIFEALNEQLGDLVTYLPGVDFDSEINIDQAVEEAKNSDIILLCLGENSYCETPGNINDLTLPAVQLSYAKRLSALGKPIILVLVEGRPRIINSIVDNMSAILMTYLPGMEGGNAIADVLIGKINPSGRLPFTYPRYTNDLIHYDHKMSEETQPNTYNPQWPFSFGIQYTNYRFTNLRTDKTKYTANDNIIVKVDVKNIGDRSGKVSLDLFVRDQFASITPPVKRLKRFKKLMLEPGESKTINFILNSDDLKFVNSESTWILEPGLFTIFIENLEKDFELID